MTESRRNWMTLDIVKYCWSRLHLPEHALKQLQLRGGDNIAIASSFKIGHLAQSSIALSALLAALIKSHVLSTSVPRVLVDRRHSVIEFQSERLYLLNGSQWITKTPVGGLYAVKDGYVRVHDGFPVHRNAALKLGDCPSDASREMFATRLQTKLAKNLEDAAVEAGAVIYALRSYEEWDSTDQGAAVPSFPISITKISSAPPIDIPKLGTHGCLSGLRVLEMSRVIAAPVAGRCLAAHGADVLWVTSPNLPDQPELDIDFSRGKRTIRLDVDVDEEKERLFKLIDEADVFLQSYRPGSLKAKNLGIEDFLARKQRQGRPIIYANLSAWGTEGPWAHRRGFDSIVQTVSGMNVSEGEHYGSNQARPLPCQALDHASGFMLASGIMTALYQQIIEGGSYTVDVSLAGVMKHLRSLGQYPDDTGFRGPRSAEPEDVPSEMTELRETIFGQLSSLKHSAIIENTEIGWKELPKKLGSDEPVWIAR